FHIKFVSIIYDQILFDFLSM
ncbi:unnamed protein product, partial [Rotaria sp. Silwood2]